MEDSHIRMLKEQLHYSYSEIVPDSPRKDSVEKMTGTELRPMNPRLKCEKTS